MFVVLFVPWQSFWRLPRRDCSIWWTWDSRSVRTGSLPFRPDFPRSGIFLSGSPCVVHHFRIEQLPAQLGSRRAGEQFLGPFPGWVPSLRPWAFWYLLLCWSLPEVYSTEPLPLRQILHGDGWLGVLFGPVASGRCSTILHPWLPIRSFAFCCGRNLSRPTTFAWRFPSQPWW